MANVTLQLPEPLYRRLLNTAQATRRPVEEVIVHAVAVGSPPAWDDVPAEFQPDLADMDRLDDATLWRIAESQMSKATDDRYDELIDRNREGELTDAERIELQGLREAADRFMLQKAHAAALLRWRGRRLPVP